MTDSGFADGIKLIIGLGSAIGVIALVLVVSGQLIMGDYSGATNTSLSGLASEIIGGAVIGLILALFYAIMKVGK